MNSQPAEKSSSLFIPFLLLGLGVIVLFGWNLWIAASQHAEGIRISAQQEVDGAQAARLEERLKLMMEDLVALAKTDTEAAAIVTRYKIAFTPPGQAPAAKAP